MSPAPRAGALVGPVRLVEPFVLSADSAIDKRRIKTIYGTLISFHGRDKFTFQIFENGRGHLIDFPNDSTRICPELLERLKKVVGDESWRIEPIVLQ